MIGAARPEDKAAVMEVYRACFPGEEGFCRFFFDNVYRPDNTLVCRVEGKLAASVQLLPVRLHLGGAVVPATYIYAAGTLPQFRSRGLMSRLLRRSFEVSAARGDELSVLIVQQPSLLAYYARLGYRAVFARECFRVSADGGTAQPRHMRPEDWRAADALYEDAQTGLHAVRAEKDWQIILRQYGEDAWVLTDDAGAVTAFALTEELKDGVLHATEALGGQSRELMAALAARKGAQAAEWFAPVCAAAEENGCARALTQNGERLLQQMRGCGYLNVLFN